MSKECLEVLSNKIRCKKEYIRDNFYRVYFEKNDLEFLEHSLQRLEQIDNANPSEALECLEKIVDKERINVGSCCHWRECLSKNKCILHNNDLMCSDYTRANTVKQALIKSQEMEKVLSIIKEKCIGNNNIDLVLNCKEYVTYIHYLGHFPTTEDKRIVLENKTLTQEEFELLKMFCENEKEY